MAQQDSITYAYPSLEDFLRSHKTPQLTLPPSAPSLEEIEAEAAEVAGLPRAVSWDALEAGGQKASRENISRKDQRVPGNPAHEHFVLSQSSASASSPLSAGTNRQQRRASVHGQRQRQRQGCAQYPEQRQLQQPVQALPPPPSDRPAQQNAAYGNGHVHVPPPSPAQYFALQGYYPPGSVPYQQGLYYQQAPQGYPRPADCPQHEFTAPHQKPNGNSCPWAAARQELVCAVKQELVQGITAAVKIARKRTKL